MKGKKQMDKGRNLNDIYTACDQFICSQCGIELRNWDAIERDNEINDIIHYEFVFKFCPNCGADMRERKDDNVRNMEQTNA